MESTSHFLSDSDKVIFEALQEQLASQFQYKFPDPLAHKTMIIVPSLSLDPELLAKIAGHIHYEERLLCLLLLLRMPRTNIIVLGSRPGGRWAHYRCGAGRGSDK